MNAAIPTDRAKQIAWLIKNVQTLLKRPVSTGGGGGGTGSEQVVYSAYYNDLDYPGIAVAQSGVSAGATDPVIQTITDRFFIPDSTTAHAAVSYNSSTGQWTLTDGGLYTIWVVADVYNPATTSGWRRVSLNDPQFFPGGFAPSVMFPADTRADIGTQVQLFATGVTAGGAGRSFSISVQSSVANTHLDGLYVGIVKHAQFIPA